MKDFLKTILLGAIPLSIIVLFGFFLMYMGVADIFAILALIGVCGMVCWMVGDVIKDMMEWK